MKTRTIILGIVASSVIGFAQNYNFNESTNNTIYVKVIKSTPVYENIIERIPYQECKNVNVPINSGGTGSTIDNNIGALIGGIAGGILGNQIGGGSGKTVATIGGAILGSAVGNRMSSNNQRGQQYYEQKRICEEKYKESSRRILSGYNNVAYYNGQEIIKFSEQKLQNIPVTISISY